jgi:hypothetical protein
MTGSGGGITPPTKMVATKSNIEWTFCGKSELSTRRLTKRLTKREVAFLTGRDLE